MMFPGAEEVIAGARHLDRVQPFWRSLISPGDLDMTNGCRCVMGQVYGIRENSHPQMINAFSTEWKTARAELGEATVGTYNIYPHTLGFSIPESIWRDKSLYPYVPTDYESQHEDREPYEQFFWDHLERMWLSIIKGEWTY